jgi:transcriptional regulator with XRE-family HTH domain
LAQKIGIEQSYLSKLENDKSVPSNENFNNILQAFGLTLDQFVTEFTQGAELDRLKQIPDIQQYFLTKKIITKNNQRRFLYVSSLLIVLATTLFYVGYSKQLFSETRFQYGSEGIILENEPVNVFYRWRDLLTPEQDNDRDFKALKKIEMANRVNRKTISVFEHAGPYFRINTPGGYRNYRLIKEKELKRQVNAWLQVFGVFLFSAGIMGFVLERRLFKSSL